MTGLAGAGELGLFSGFVGNQGIPSDPTRKMGVISSAMPSHLSHDRWILTALLVSSGSMPLEISVLVLVGQLLLAAN